MGAEDALATTLASFSPHGNREARCGSKLVLLN